MTQARNARANIAVASAQRRPWRSRSRRGPTTGATIANGAMVIRRYRATLPRASPSGTSKKSVPAKDTAMRVSPAELIACSSMTLARPDSPAPPACVARLIRRKVPLAASLPNRAIEAAVDLAAPTARCALSAPRRPKSSLTSQSCPTQGTRQAMFLCGPLGPQSPFTWSGIDPVRRGGGAYARIGAVNSGTRSRSKTVDAQCAAAVDLARASAAEVAGADHVGDHLGVTADADRVVTHYFDCLATGYRGWRWA